MPVHVVFTTISLHVRLSHCPPYRAFTLVEGTVLPRERIRRRRRSKGGALGVGGIVRDNLRLRQKMASRKSTRSC